MRVLAVDVGTGTQDVLLFDTDREIENAVRLVLPSPTAIVAMRIRSATREGRPVVLGGQIMGGGPSAWAARDHALAGLPIAATAAAARTFDDDLEAVAAMGVRVVEEGDAVELAAAPDAVAIELGDLDLPALEAALARFGVRLGELDALAVAVFDHGAAPAGVSDRRFRFERLAERLTSHPSDGPAAFAYRAEDVPAPFTRLGAAARMARGWLAGHGRADVPVVAMDTGPAAVLGGSDDRRARAAAAAGRPIVAVNVGNFHALAMRLGPDGRIQALMEHHTGELDRARLARLVARTAAGTISGAEVFATMGHGAWVVPGWEGDRLRERARPRPLLLVTGPRRGLLGERVVRGLGRAVYAVPHGDMMQAGPLGLLRALARLEPVWREPVERRLGPAWPAAKAHPQVSRSTRPCAAPCSGRG